MSCGAGCWNVSRRLGILIRHETAPIEMAFDRARAHAVLRPEPVGFISYPYEWSFSQLRDAALLTLDAHRRAQEAGFILRDATAYNVQFHRGRPVLIDTLSFERADPNAPWIAYRQFCEQFLAPLALMAHRDIRCGLLLRPYIDGIPLDLAARLLPVRTRFDLGLASHVHAHARAQRRYADRTPSPRRAGRIQLSPLRQAALLDSLRRTVERLTWQPIRNERLDYADRSSYSDEAIAAKESIVRRMLGAIDHPIVWDIGANSGRFSRIAAERARRVIAWDTDPSVTESHYRRVRRDEATNILPLLGDVALPSPALGWGLAERGSMRDRADADILLALALVHHLAIARNIPLGHLAAFFAQVAPNLIIEFVPREDPMVQRLLATREDVFPDYDLVGFRRAIDPYFVVREAIAVPGSTRVLFHLQRHG